MGATAEAISLVISLTQLATQAMSASNEVMGIIQKARNENREVTDEELNNARNLLMSERAKLASGG